MLIAMQSKQIATILFWLAFAFSMALSLLLISALVNFGLQPGPIWTRLLGFFLIFMPFAALVGRWIARDTKRYDVVTGSVIVAVVFSYGVVMLAMNR